MANKKMAKGQHNWAIPELIDVYTVAQQGGIRAKIGLEKKYGVTEKAIQIVLSNLEVAMGAKSKRQTDVPSKYYLAAEVLKGAASVEDAEKVIKVAASKVAEPKAKITTAEQLSKMLSSLELGIADFITAEVERRCEGVLKQTKLIQEELYDVKTKYEALQEEHKKLREAAKGTNFALVVKDRLNSLRFR